jgi:hypothetical protein
MSRSTTPRRLMFGLIALLVFGHGLAWSGSLHGSPRLEAMVRSLYRVVLARQPIGISTSPRFLTTFGPYLSKSLVDKIRVDRLCELDWVRRHRGQVIKPPFTWLELGLFSGFEDYVGPTSYEIVRAEPRRDGSTDVLVRLRESQAYLPGSWDVALRIVKENGRFVVADVTYLKSEGIDYEMRLTEVLWRGCRGARWVGNPRVPSARTN